MKNLFIHARVAIAAIVCLALGACSREITSEVKQPANQTREVDSSLCTTALMAVFHEAYGNSPVRSLRVEKTTVPWTGDRSIEAIIGNEWLRTCPFTSPYWPGIADAAADTGTLDCLEVVNTLRSHPNHQLSRVACDHYGDVRLKSTECIAHVTLPAYAKNQKSCVVCVMLQSTPFTAVLYAVEMSHTMQGWLVIHNGVGGLAVE